MMGTSGIQGIYRYRYEIRVSDIPDCRWLLAEIPVIKYISESGSVSSFADIA